MALNSFLAASFVKFLTDQLGRRHGALPRDTIVKSSAGVDLRPYLNKNVPAEQLAQLSGKAYLYHPVAEQGAVWQFAAEYHAALRRSIERLEPVQWARSLARPTEGTDPAAYAAAHQTLVPYALITNIGRLDWPDAFGVHRLERVLGSLPMHRNWQNDTGLGICACVVARKININLHYLAEAYTSEEGFALARSFASRLLEA